MLYHLGRDTNVGVGRRLLSRTLSFYERAPARVLLGLDGSPILWDEPVIWPLKRLLLLFMAEQAWFWREAAPAQPPHSGWWGSAFVITIWAGLAAAMLYWLPVVPPASTRPPSSGFTHTKSSLVAKPSNSQRPISV